jgi:hypothetical protein
VPKKVLRQLGAAEADLREVAGLRSGRLELPERADRDEPADLPGR